MLLLLLEVQTSVTPPKVTVLTTDALLALVAQLQATLNSITQLLTPQG